MKLLKNLKQKSENKKNIDRNKSVSLQNRSLEETYQEIKRQIKYEQAALDNEKRRYEQDTRMDALQIELDQIESQMQAAHVKNKKRWLKLLLFWVIFAIAMGALLFYIRNSHQQELEAYRQQLEMNLNEYIIEIEVQKQDLQQQIETLIQQMDSIKASSNER